MYLKFLNLFNVQTNDKAPIYIGALSFLFIFISIVFLCTSICFAHDYHLNIEKYKLPNGLTVILEEDNSSGLVNFQLWIRAGSCYEGEFLGSGITHFVEHMVFKGKESGLSSKIAQEIQSLGGELDASTSKEYTHFDITISKDNIIKGMELVYGVITNAEFMQEELDKERDVILHEMDMIQDDPHKFLTDAFFRTAFDGHPYGEPVIGNKDLFCGITKEDIKKYYKSAYIPRNMTLVLAGNFSVVSIKLEIERIWGGLTNSFGEQQKYIPKTPSIIGPVIRVFPKNVLSTHMIAGFYGPSIDSNDIYAMDILAEVAGGGKNSRLTKILRDKLGLVSSISAWSYTPTCTGIWGVNADLIQSDWHLVLKNILKEIYRFRYKLINEKELSSAKKRILQRYLASLETINGRANDLGSSEIYARNPLFCRTYVEGIKRVAAEDIKRCAQEYFNARDFSSSILVPENIEKKQEGKDTYKRHDAIQKIQLNNGLEFLIKEDHRLPLISIRIAGLGGLLEEDMPGLSYLVSQLWLKENQDLVKDIESKGGSISTYSGSNSLGCNIEIFSEDIVQALETVKKLIQEMSVGSEKLELLKNIQLANIKQEEDSPYAYTSNLAKNIFFEDHPYNNSILGTAESVAKIDKQSAVEFFDKYIKSGNLVISLFGDINVKNIDSLVLNTFESMPRTIIKQKKDVRQLLPKINKERKYKNIEQTVVILTYPGLSLYSDDRYALELLVQIFSGQAGRLFESIRELQALSYSTGALDFTGREDGAILFYIVTDKEGVNTAVELLFKEIVKVKQEGVSEDELKRVKSYYLTQTHKAWESTSGLSLEATLDELYGLGYDYYKKYLDNIEKVTKEDIKNVANKYLRDDWHTLVIVGPADKIEAEAID